MAPPRSAPSFMGPSSPPPAPRWASSGPRYRPPPAVQLPPASKSATQHREAPGLPKRPATAGSRSTLKWVGPQPSRPTSAGAGARQPVTPTKPAPADLSYESRLNSGTASRISLAGAPPPGITFGGVDGLQVVGFSYMRDLEEKLSYSSMQAHALLANNRAASEIIERLEREKASSAYSLSALEQQLKLEREESAEQVAQLSQREAEERAAHKSALEATAMVQAASVEEAAAQAATVRKVRAEAEAARAEAEAAKAEAAAAVEALEASKLGGGKEALPPEEQKTVTDALADVYAELAAEGQGGKDGEAGGPMSPQAAAGEADGGSGLAVPHGWSLRAWFASIGLPSVFTEPILSNLLPGAEGNPALEMRLMAKLGEVGTRDTVVALLRTCPLLDLTADIIWEAMGRLTNELGESKRASSGGRRPARRAGDAGDDEGEEGEDEGGGGRRRRRRGGDGEPDDGGSERAASPPPPAWMCSMDDWDPASLDEMGDDFLEGAAGGLGGKMESVGLDEALPSDARDGEPRSTASMLSEMRDTHLKSSFTLTYGGVPAFYQSLSELVGLPSTKGVAQMQAEHCAMKDSNLPFLAPNYRIKTTSRIEWYIVANPEDGLAELGIDDWPKGSHSREVFPPSRLEPKWRDINSRLARVDEDPLLLESLIGLRAYTGPLFVKYNSVLRASYPKTATARDTERLMALTGGNCYGTTLHFLIQGIAKLAKIQKSQPVYRAPGGLVPPSFWEPNEHGVVGGIEMGFMSTTTAKAEALHYARRSGAPLLFEIQQGMVARGADVSWLSQFPSEDEVLFAPLSALEVHNTHVDGTVLVVELRPSVSSAAMQSSLELKAEHERASYQSQISCLRSKRTGVQLARLKDQAASKAEKPTGASKAQVRLLAARHVWEGEMMRTREAASERKAANEAAAAAARAVATARAEERAAAEAAAAEAAAEAAAAQAAAEAAYKAEAEAAEERTRAERELGQQARHAQRMATTLVRAAAKQREQDALDHESAALSALSSQTRATVAEATANANAAKEDLEKLRKKSEQVIAALQARAEKAEEEAKAALPMLLERRLRSDVKGMKSMEAVVHALRRFSAPPFAGSVARGQEAAEEEEDVELSTLDQPPRRRLITACCEQLCALNDKDNKNRGRAVTEGALDLLLDCIGELEALPDRSVAKKQASGKVGAEKAAAAAAAKSPGKQTEWGLRTQIGERGDLYACCVALASILRGAGLQQTAVEAGVLETAVQAVPALATPAATAVKYLTAGNEAYTKSAKVAGARELWVSGEL